LPRRCRCRWCGPRLRLHQADAARRWPSIDTTSGELAPTSSTPTIPAMGQVEHRPGRGGCIGHSHRRPPSRQTVAMTLDRRPKAHIRRCLPHARVVRGIGQNIGRFRPPLRSPCTSCITKNLDDEAVTHLAQKSFCDCLLPGRDSFHKQRADKTHTPPPSRRAALETLRASAHAAMASPGTPARYRVGERCRSCKPQQHAPAVLDHSRLRQPPPADIDGCVEHCCPHVRPPPQTRGAASPARPATWHGGHSFAA